MDHFTDDELRAEYRRANLMGAIADDAGEADASNLFASIQRACEFAALERRLSL